MPVDGSLAPSTPPFGGPPTCDGTPTITARRRPQRNNNNGNKAPRIGNVAVETEMSLRFSRLFAERGLCGGRRGWLRPCKGCCCQ